MSHSFRQAQIMDIARREGMLTVDGLATHFDVTHQTIRRDLSELAQEGVLERVHGGAILRGSTSNIGYEKRQTLNADGKEAMARGCAAHIPDQITLFLDIGTSTEAVARSLGAHTGLIVVTNNLNVANILAGHESCDVIVTGGQLRRSDGGLTGTLAREAIGRFKFDIAVTSCSALDADGDMMDFDTQEIGLRQAILQQTRQRIVLADHTKLTRTAPARIGSLSEVEMIITDRPLPPELAKACASWKTDVHVAPEDQSSR
ncbi:DeoR/GlpR family DNA-binding transcription regulator [Palleronia caenipelagi]|uniref:DeoR/GlpR transcriptional regulator n=1 Tax=Palleronia caenipelagi TaxID=2489174 RepID=A0A547QAC4_9RHOB|nr:DeoR/GlpR family DNA-binding transcription regulator [Palleronia caenipelagi]TRD23320.1 DeoR/GlpR transcriptional regulator [Palleronia caenipelagi]